MMMVGTIRWNFVLGGIGFLLTFLTSITQNLWLTTMVRSFYCFIILFAVTFVIRWILGTVVGLNQIEQSSASTNPDLQETEIRGQHLDLTTPQDDNYPVLGSDEDDDQEQKRHNEGGFSPLQPPKLTKKEKVDPEDVVKAVRHLSEDEGE
jgi:hypothetical protein